MTWYKLYIYSYVTSSAVHIHLIMSDTLHVVVDVPPRVLLSCEL